MPKLPVLATALVIPVLLTAVANFARRVAGLSTSTGGDLVLAALLVDAAVVILLEKQQPLGLPQATFRSAMVVVALIGATVFFRSIKIQRALDERAFCAWANRKRATTKHKFEPEIKYSRTQTWCLWVTVNSLIGLHAGVLLLL